MFLSGGLLVNQLCLRAIFLNKDKYQKYQISNNGPFQELFAEAVQATHYSECVLRNNRALFLAVSIANSSTVDSSMFHEVLVIPYIKIYEFEPLSPRGILVFFWNALSVWEAQETKNKSSSLTLTKASQLFM